MKQWTITYIHQSTSTLPTIPLIRIPKIISFHIHFLCRNSPVIITITTHLADSSFFMRWAVFSLALMNWGLFLFNSISWIWSNKQKIYCQGQPTAMTIINPKTNQVLVLLLHLRDVPDEFCMLLLFLLQFILDLPLLLRFPPQRVVLSIQLLRQTVDLSFVVVEFEELQI